MVLANKTDKDALQEWEDLLFAIRNSTPIDINEAEAWLSRPLDQMA